MTKSEATAIFESCCRASRALNVEMPWVDMSTELKAQVLERLKPAMDEIGRISEMAKAELER